MFTRWLLRIAYRLHHALRRYVVCCDAVLIEMVPRVQLLVVFVWYDSAANKDEDSEMELSHLRVIAPHYWLPGSGVPESPPLWYPYLPAYSPQAAAAAAAALAGGYKLVPDSATGHCYIIPGQYHSILLLIFYLWHN